MSEGLRDRLLPAIERRHLVDRRVWEIVIQLAGLWVLVFALLAVLLSFGISPVYGTLSIGADAARGATLVDAAMVILLNVLPPK